jgi:hypothetical protein
MATVTKSDRSLIATLGPLYLEFLIVTSVSNDDTITSKLASPSGAFMVPLGDAGGTVGCSASVSGKTITLRDPTSATTHLVLVIGNALT